MNKKKHNKKFLAAMAMGVLVFSGLAINVSALDNNSLNIPTDGLFKEIKNNPYDFINATKVSVPTNFDNIEQMNREFVDNFSTEEKVVYRPGDSLNKLEKESSQDE